MREQLRPGGERVDHQLGGIGRLELDGAEIGRGDQSESWQGRARSDHAHKIRPGPTLVRDIARGVPLTDAVGRRVGRTEQ